MSEAPEMLTVRLSRKQSIYLDTTVPSYLAAKPNRNLWVLRQQRQTCLWWHVHRESNEVFISAQVINEAKRGNPTEAQRRLDLISPLTSLSNSADAEKLSRRILSETGLPDQIGADAEHIAIAATHGIDFLLTWNCKHLANPALTPKVRNACERAGFRSPEICTPEAIMRKYHYGRQSDS